MSKRCTARALCPPELRVLTVPFPTTNSLVSIILPTYNRAHTIVAALRSVLDQSYPAVEVLIIDDGSNDATEPVVREYVSGHPLGGKVRYLWQEKAGAPAARNRGLREAQGEFIQFLDSDDGLFPSKLTAQVKMLRDDPEMDMVYCRCQYRYFAADGSPIGESVAGEMAQDPVGLMIRRCYFHINSPLWRLAVCKQAGSYDESLPSSQDWDYGFRLLLHSRRIAFQPDILAWARRQKAGSIGGLPDRVQSEAAVKVRLKMLAELHAQSNLPASWKHQYVLGSISQAMYFAARGQEDLAKQLLTTVRDLHRQGWGGHMVAALLAVGRVVGWKWLELARRCLRRRSYE
jgi:glycosyltransferase involved in cell wall biosynthesis